jgi:hypothetical protein
MRTEFGTKRDYLEIILDNPKWSNPRSTVEFGYFFRLSNRGSGDPCVAIFRHGSLGVQTVAWIQEVPDDLLEREIRRQGFDPYKDIFENLECSDEIKKWLVSWARSELSSQKG